MPKIGLGFAQHLLQSEHVRAVHQGPHAENYYHGIHWLWETSMEFGYYDRATGIEVFG